MVKFIVAIETVKIKEFLFSTNKLRVIRGASYLLDYLNQVEVPKILEENDITEDNIIYIGAGNAKFFVERDTVEEAKAAVDKIIAEVKEKYEKEAPGAKVVGVYVPTEYEKGKRSSEGKEVWYNLDKLGELTVIEKSKGFSTLNIDLPYIEKCELSGNEVAEVDCKNLVKDLRNLGYILNEDESEVIISEKKSLNDKVDKISIESLQDQIKKLAKTTGRISEATLKKIIASNLLKNSRIAIEKKVGFYQYIKNYINTYNKNDKNQKVAIELRTNIDDFENEDSFIGFMYSDGDALGDFFKNLKNIFKNLEIDNAEESYIKFLKYFSKNLDETTKQSLSETLIDIFKNTKDEKRWGEFLIVGGDDVCAVFDPTLALDISYNFQKKFEEKMLKNMEKIVTENTKKILNSKVTSSSGVIIAKTKTPMFQLFEQGLNLQKNAKEKRKETIISNLNATGFIDFQVIGSEGCVNIKSFRESVSSDSNKIMERPYSINFSTSNEEKKKVKNLDDLLKLIYKMKKINFPSNKLRYIYDLKRDSNLGDTKKKMNFINILSKMSDEHIKFIVNDLELDYKELNTFDNNFNNIFDILEIYDFIEEKEVKI